ncbi:glycosyltransferase family 4 protein [Deinococcus marmoris]|uniref:glycosyltransferase family 4 protein n=1 Tax=Deinococcus marmoris TaxID=249408 RepID=UPI00096A7463|nr:glycosyltransferase family 4 protein [Deinococcus marmoris]
MKVAVAGPFTLAPFRAFLDNPADLTIPKGMGGTPVVNLVNELLSQGHQVTVITLDPQVSAPQTYRGSRLTIHVGPLRPRARYRMADAYRQERAYVTWAASKADADLIHAHWTYEYALGALQSKLPTLITAHDAPLNVFKYAAGPYYAIRLLMASRVAHRASRMTAVSPYVADHFRRYLRYRGDMRIIPNGLMSDSFTPNITARFTRPIVYVSVPNGWGGWKNTSTLLKAFAIVRQEIPEARLRLYGKATAQGEITERWAAQHSLGQGVDFMGNRTHTQLLHELRENCDVLVHPSLEESFSMTIIEAMACGLPTIGGSSSGGVPWVLDQGMTGALTDVRSASTLADTMLYLAQSDEVRLTYAQRGHDKALNQYNNEYITRTYVDEYEHMLGVNR